MRRNIAVAVVCLGIALCAAVLLTPAPGAACSPCEVVESGEQWKLEVVSWTVDDAEMAVPDAGPTLSVSNRYHLEPIDPSVPPPDVFLDAELFDPRSPNITRDVALTPVQR